MEDEGSVDSSATSRNADPVKGAVAESGQGGGSGKFAPASDRPYHGSEKGRLEGMQEDATDAKLRAEAAKLENQTLETRAGVYSQHGNVGFSGNYEITPETES